jgi:hypothetical protein
MSGNRTIVRTVLYAIRPMRPAFKLCAESLLCMRAPNREVGVSHHAPEES